MSASALISYREALQYWTLPLNISKELRADADFLKVEE